MNRIVRESLLFDFYGELLTAKKRRVMSLYHEENWSLAEIAEELGISRAAVSVRDDKCSLQQAISFKQHPARHLVQKIERGEHAQLACYLP